jgi:hypothetical protein
MNEMYECKNRRMEKLMNEMINVPFEDNPSSPSDAEESV